MTWYFLPPTLRVKCRVLKIGKCTWLGWYVVALLKLQSWLNQCWCCVHLKKYKGYQ
jgi:hypothetical protein